MSTIVDMGAKPVNKRVHRYDRFAMGANVQVTPQGFLKIPATIARTGILEYRRSDGSTWKELVLPEELHKRASLSTLASAPLTEDHQGMISPDNVGQHRVGHVSEVVSPNGDFLDTHLIVENRSTIDGVSNGNFKELSAGYGADVEFKEGTWNGQHYDAIQRNRVYNHVALGPEGWARGGSELSLHLDSKDENDTAYAVHLDSKDAAAGTPVENKQPRGMKMKKITIRLDGVDYEIEVPEALASNLMSSVEKLKTAGKETAKRLDSVQGELDSVQGELDASKQTNEELKGKLEAATDPAAIEKAVTARVKLVQDCKKLHPEIETDGKDDKTLKVEALAKAGFESVRFDGKSDAYIDGVFEAKVEAAPEASGGKTPSIGILPVTQEREDAKPERTADEARAEMVKRGQDAYKTGAAGA